MDKKPDKDQEKPKGGQRKKVRYNFGSQERQPTRSQPPPVQTVSRCEPVRPNFPESTVTPYPPSVRYSYRVQHGLNILHHLLRPQNPRPSMASSRRPQQQAGPQYPTPAPYHLATQQRLAAQRQAVGPTIAAPRSRIPQSTFTRSPRPVCYTLTAPQRPETRRSTTRPQNESSTMPPKISPKPTRKDGKQK